MGWFGSLDLAYKYAVNKFLQKSNLEAAGAQEERVELNKREPDEGDLFGVRAIQSGFFGGVAQSRPSSLAESNSPEGSSSNTLLGSHASPKTAAQSPMSSVTTLPLDARRSSPLAHEAMSSEDLTTPTKTKRRVPTPLRSTLAPSDAELSGRTSHDPAVNMLLEIPPSPLASSRPTTAYSDTHDRTPSAYFSSPHNGGQYAPLGAPQVPEQVRRSSARPVSTAETHHPEQGHHSQSASIASGTSDPYTQDDRRSAAATDQGFVTIPSKAAYDERRGSDSSDERPRSRGREEWSRSARSHPPRSSSRYNNFSQMPTIHSQEDEVTASNKPRAPNAVGDWGPDIFKEIDQSLQESKSMNKTSTDDRYNHHTSSLSDTSSIYSTTQTYSRPGRQTSIDSKIQPRQSTGPKIVLDSRDVIPEQDGRRRGSDTSLREQSGQERAYSQSNKQNLRTADMAGDGRRTGRMEVDPETIVEVPHPSASPSIGKAM
ncbi:MAG: hypothetical protein Q9216_000069 [Gyalolechia sp. 2 TL-2023]